MDFWQYPTAYASLKRARLLPKQSWQEFYDYATELSLQNEDGTSYNQFLTELFWYEDRRPYYCVWPAITGILTKISLDIDSGLIRPPMRVLCVRIPKEKNRLSWQVGTDEHCVRSILLAEANVRHEAGLTLWINCGEEISGTPIHFFKNFRLTHGRTVEDGVRGLPYHESAKVGLQLPRDIEESCVRLAITLCLLDKNPELIVPDVLSKDLQKWQDTQDQKFVDRAIRRGKYGWHVGRDVEVVPHVRRPHPALFWTGAGRTVPIVKLRRGSIVHRDTIRRLPTGHMKDEETE